MTTYIALFRGINVGGNNIIPMKDLTALVATCGHSDVKTYIQSGNVIFKSGGSGKANGAGRERVLAKEIAAAVRKSRGFEPRVVVLSLAALRNIAAANPFPQAVEDPKSVHVFFLAEPAKSANIKAMEAVKTKNERFALKGDAFYVHAPEGLGRSKLGSCCERHLGVDATARNWRTVTTLIELAEAASA
ncbi:MAG TPA: DUF1697 domain-containing protein [Vicinamibacterales bacterium]|jgi:uncharacterized protein (DUF1697 family)|nr:DUF1697 domain-containing protein [Vicinamibacterales bacterium]